MKDTRIVIIEDNPMNRELVVDVLEAAGCQVFQAASAEEGIRLVRQLLPSLVLMDLSLPGMDGLAATRVLKEDPLTSVIPVLAVTALAMRGDEERIRAAGCNGYIAKPLDVVLLRTEVMRILETKGTP